MTNGHTIKVTPGNTSVPACIHVRSIATGEVIGREVAGPNENPALFHAINRIAEMEREHERVWETLIRVGDSLGIDPEEARSAPGKPSDVYLNHLARRDSRMAAEALEHFARQMRGAASGGLNYSDEEAAIARSWAARADDMAAQKRREAERGA